MFSWFNCFVVEGKEDKVYRLKKALYGLKQAPRAWYGQIDGYFIKKSFHRCKSEPTLYIKTEGTSIIIVSLYVDDLIFMGNDHKMLQDFKADMMKTYEMNDLGLMHYFLGIEMSQNDKGIFICQKKYVESILKKFNMDKCNSVTTPLVVNEKLMKDDGSVKVNESLYRSVIGSLLYLSSTRPEIIFAASLLSRFMHCPNQTHLRAAKRVLRYIRGTSDFGILYYPIADAKLIGYTDSDWGGSVDDMRSTSGYAFSFGSGIFSWVSKKQDTTALSSAEAEYVSASLGTCQALWLRKILEDLDEKQDGGTVMYCDNKFAI